MFFRAKQKQITYNRKLPVQTVYEKMFDFGILPCLSVNNKCLIALS